MTSFSQSSTPNDGNNTLHQQHPPTAGARPQRLLKNTIKELICPSNSRPKASLVNFVTKDSCKLCSVTLPQLPIVHAVIRKKFSSQNNLELFKDKICSRRTTLTSVSLTDSVSYLLPKMPLSCLKDFLIALSVVFVDFLSFWFLLPGLWRVLSNLMPSSTHLICNTTLFNRGPSRKSRFFPSVVTEVSL